MILFKNLGNIRYVFRLLKDESVPKWNKAVLIFALVYFFLPVDFIPEAVFPGLGYLDDLMVILGALNSLSDIFAGYRATKQEDKTPGKIIMSEDIEYSVEDEEPND